MDATIPFHFHTKCIFYTHMLLSACFWQFHSWNFQIHAMSCDIYMKCMGAGSTPKLPVADVAATCSMLQKLLVLHWCMAPSAAKMVSVEPGYPDCITGIYICGSDLWPVHDPCEPCDISHCLPDRQVWSMLLDGCKSKKVWDAGVSCSTDSLGLMVDLNCWICQMMAGTDSCVRKTGQSPSMLPFIHQTGSEGLC